MQLVRRTAAMYWSWVGACRRSSPPCAGHGQTVSHQGRQIDVLCMCAGLDVPPGRAPTLMSQLGRLMPSALAVNSHRQPIRLICTQPTCAPQTSARCTPKGSNAPWVIGTYKGDMEGC